MTKINSNKPTNRIFSGIQPTGNLHLGNYLGAIKSSLDSPNMILDLRIPKNQRYQQVVLDTEVHRFVSGEITKEEAMQRIHDGWEEITEEMGRDTQLKAYRSTLGY